MVLSIIACVWPCNLTISTNFTTSPTCGRNFFYSGDVGYVTKNFPLENRIQVVAFRERLRTQSFLPQLWA